MWGLFQGKRLLVCFTSVDVEKSPILAYSLISIQPRFAPAGKPWSLLSVARCVSLKWEVS
jgi:hypothetical protein